MENTELTKKLKSIADKTTFLNTIKIRRDSIMENGINLNFYTEYEEFNVDCGHAANIAAKAILLSDLNKMIAETEKELTELIK